MSGKISLFSFSVLEKISGIAAQDWERVFGKDLLEGYNYHKAVEESQIAGFSLRYLAVKQAGRIAAIFPFFITRFCFTAIIRGRLQKLIFFVRKRFTGFLSAKMAFLGLPTAEKFYLGLNQQADLEPLMRGALNALNNYCRKEKIRALLFYNLSAQEKTLADYLEKEGFAQIQNLPATVIEIKWGCLEDYVKDLGKSTRKNMRRILRAQEAWGLKTELLESAENIIEEIYPLYLNTLGASDINFEVLSKEFFLKIPRYMPGIAKYFITRDAQGKIIAFNLCLVKEDVCIDKFVGFDPAASKKYRLYYATFCQNIDWCIKNKIRFYQPGQSDYDPKIRLGAKLIPLYIYVKTFYPVIDIFKGIVTALASPKNFDPALKNLAKYKRKDLYFNG